MHKDMARVLESTTIQYDEEVVKPILEESGLKVGKDFSLSIQP